MANSGITRNVDTIISTLNKKADTNLANSAKAGEIENIANSAASAAQSAATVAQAASELINTALPQKVNKNGDTFNGSVVVDGDLTVTGEINATITGSSESAMSATKDSSGNVIVDTYATKAQLNTTNTNVATNATNITTVQNRADSAYTLANSKVSSSNGTMTFTLDDYNVDFRKAGDEGNYTVALVTNKTLDNTKVYNTLIDKTGKFLPEFGTDLSVNNATISLKNGNDVISSVIVNNVANATSAATCTGNAATSTKLSAAKTIAISGGATGTATSFDGSSNITIPVTALDVSKASAGILAVNRGGTGSSTKNFVDLSSNQTIAGTKTFSSTIAGSISGTAAKATQDSAGQQINKTYIKALSVSGKIITYTKGDGTTGTITTQDTNTTYSNMTAATAEAAGKAGLVPAPAAGKQASFLRGDGTWVVPTNTKYSNFTKATSSAAGKAGLVPAPAAGDQAKFLRGDATWQLITGLSLPAGSVIAFAGNPSSAPSGFLLCNGANVSRTTYANLFSAIGTTYGTGDGSSTFTLPNMTDKFIQGSDTAGTVKEAGLPNIAAHVNQAVGTSAYTDESPNAFVISGTNDSTYSAAGGEHFYFRKLNFYASEYNSIYSGSDTVQPPALTMRYYIKY